jgi:hypothetical protein
MKNIPKAVEITLMYRDGCNFKNIETYRLSNKKELSEQEISDALEKLIDDSFIPGYYGINDNPAPMNNEFLPGYQNDYDHSFVELCEWEFADEPTHNDADEIYDVVKSINNPAIVKKKRAEAKVMAINIMKDAIDSIRKIKT